MNHPIPPPRLGPKKLVWRFVFLDGGFVPGSIEDVADREFLDLYTSDRRL
jgi:hypothetical protein